MTMQRPRKRTRIVPRLIFQSAAVGIVPAIAVSCGGSVSDHSGSGTSDAAADGRTSTGGSTIIALAIGGFGNQPATGGRVGAGGGIIVLAIGGFGGTWPGVAAGGFGWGGAIPLAMGGFGNYPGTGGVPEGGPGDAAPDGTPDSEAGSGTGGGIWILAMNGFGAGGTGNKPGNG